MQPLFRSLLAVAVLFAPLAFISKGRGGKRRRLSFVLLGRARLRRTLWQRCLRFHARQEDPRG